MVGFLPKGFPTGYAIEEKMKMHSEGVNGHDQSIRSYILVGCLLPLPS